MAEEVEKPNPPQAGEESAPPPEQRQPLVTPKVTYDPKAYWWVLPLLIAGFLGLLLLLLGVAGWYFRERIPVIAGFFTTPTPTLTATLPTTPTRLPSHTPTPAPSLTFTPTPLPTSTPTITPTPTPAWPQTFAEPILAAIAGLPPNFEADFSTGAGRVSTWQCSAPACVVADGVMRVSIATGNMTLGGYLRARDFALQFDVTPVTTQPDSIVRFFLRHIQGLSNEIDLDLLVQPGRWAFVNNLPDAFTVIGEGAHPDIRPGETLTVLVVMRGEQAAVYLNGAPLAYGLDTGTSGDFIFFDVIAGSGETVVEFDNVKFWNLKNVPGLP